MTIKNLYQRSCGMQGRTLVIASAFLFLTSLGSCDRAGHQVSDLKVSFISNIGQAPVFSWKILAEDGFVQQACRVTVSDDPDRIDPDKGNNWDSRKVETANSIQFRYDGPELENGKEYFARVRVWDRHDRPSEWSEPVRFVVPLGYPEDW